ncbi:MAG: uracil-DNA glycosylase [Firmicutes bacterium]|nr:uracil-DNA glycosylase [Bacillota bacterium]
MVKLGNDWDELIGYEFTKPYYLKLREFLKAEYSTRKVYPNMHDIFNSLKLTPYADVKVAILGQDPYINQGEAHGLAFSVQEGVRIPPSLQNIFKEAVTDVGITMPTHGHLTNWARQGVLLLNAVLTVRAGQSKSHAGKGWEEFTTNVIKKLNDRPEPIVFLLWGRDAQMKQELITNPQHLVLTAAHPSPLAQGRFFGSQHFSQVNAFLVKYGQKEIDWQV